MKDFVSWSLQIFLIIFAVIHFFSYFFENDTLLFLLALSGFVIFLCSFIIFPIKRFKLPLFLFLTGILILFTSETPFISGVMNGLLQMRNMVGFLVVVPMISWVLKETPYIEAIMSFAHKILNTSRKMYFGIMSLTQLIAYFLLFGSIPVTYDIINTFLKTKREEAWEHFKSTAILRGFALSVMWVVSIPSFVYVVETMDASLWGSIFQGFIFSLCGIFIALVFSRLEEKRYGVDLTAHLNSEIEHLLDHTDCKVKRKSLVIEFVLIFITLFGTIFLFNGLFSIELMIIIPLVIVGWTFVYYLYKKSLGNSLRIWRNI